MSRKKNKQRSGWKPKRKQAYVRLSYFAISPTMNWADPLHQQEFCLEIARQLAPGYKDGMRLVGCPIFQVPATLAGQRPSPVMISIWEGDAVPVPAPPQNGDELPKLPDVVLGN